jgi:gliding motility-associated-like protein
MKKLITTLSLICFLFSFQAKASHIAGGDLSYVCLGGNQYQINLNLFVDCLGFDPGASQTINFTSTCGGTATATVNVTNPGGTEISQLCPTQINNSTCNGGSLPGMWVFHFTGTVTLAPPCDTWNMSWNVCCRNNAILNLVTPSSFGSYIEASLNSATAPCNNSPAFTAQPIPYVCINQVVNYSYGVVETDGDSLYYSFIGAMDAGGALLAYSPGYSATSPIPGITIDPNTGMLTFTPTTLGNFVVVVLVQEYDSNGNLIGEVMRDIQFIVQNCSNIVPDPGAGAITNLTGTAVQSGPFSIEMCEGSVFTFDATYTDVNAADVLTLITNLSTVLPGSVITTSGSNPITATITWTAPPGTANTNTTFSVTVNDGACPVPGQQTFVYDVQVQPRTIASPDQIICGPQSASLSVSGGSSFTWAVISGPAMAVGVNFSCDTCTNVVATPSATTTYEVTSNLSGTCINKDTVTVTVVPDFSFTTTQSTATLCMQQSVQFSITGSPAGAYTYLWSPAATLDNTTISNPTATLNSSGSFDYYVAITSPDGCVKRDTVTAIVQPAIRTIANPDTILCGAQSANLSATGGTAFTWSVISGPAMAVGVNFSCSNCANPVATPTSTTTYLVTSDLSGTCINMDTVTVTIVPDYTFTTTQSSSTTCLLEPIQLNTTASPAGTYSYSWSPSTYLSSTTIPDPVATISIPGTYSYVLTLTNPAGCVKLDTVVISVTPSYKPDAILSAVPNPVCINDTVMLSTTFGSSVPATCGTNPVGCSASLAATVGTTTGSNTTTTWPAIYGNWYTSTKHQMLFKASELIAAGITGGKIDQIDIPVTTISGITTYHQFTIRMGCTSLNSLGTTWVSGLFQVLNPATVNVVVGMNTHILNNAFEWDGISNIVVEICSTEGPGAFGYSNYTTSCVSPYTTTTYTSCLYSYTDAFDMCPDLTNWINQSFDRPLLRFHYCGGAADPSSFSYSWLPSGSVFNSTAQNTGAIVTGATTYSVIVTDTASGCLDTASVNVTLFPSSTIVVNAGNDTTVCPGTSVNLNATGATNYSWSPATGLSSTTIANPVATPAVTTTYTVTGTAMCAPPSIDSITITAVNSVILNVDAGNNVTICPGTSTSLLATGATNYTWSPGTALSSTTIANPTANPFTTITYTVTGTGPCANPVTDSVTVTAVNSVILNVDAGSDVTICPGTTTTLNATGATNYSWSPATALSSTIGASTISGPASTITYTVTGTGPCADPVEDSVTVNVLTANSLNIAAGADGSVCVGESVNLTATTTGGFSSNVYSWSVLAGAFSDSIHNANSLNAYVAATIEGTNIYEITVVDMCGNVANDTVIYDVTNDCEIIIPNVFTPNGDGNNDVFMIRSNGVSTFSIAIYNRWGKKVYESTDITRGWDGGGHADGTYYFVLTAEMKNGKQVDKQGYIQLLSN